MHKSKSYKKKFLMFIIGALVSVFSVASLAQESPVNESSVQEKSQRLPKGLFSQNNIDRFDAIKLVESSKNLKAVPKVSDMARNDEFSNVRAAACHALGVLGTDKQVELLRFIARSDSNVQVRSEAAKAERKIKGEPENSEVTPIFEQNKIIAEQTVEDEDHKKPTLAYNQPVLDTRHFAIGFGTMGGFGMASVDFRLKIHTKAQYLPYIGIEIGAGWTPPKAYPFISGLTVPINDEAENDIAWKLVSGAGGILFYVHRKHYIPIRAGFDPAQGAYGLLGYGYEHLNDEGFFSWNVECGILIHPALETKIKDYLKEADIDKIEIWPVIPYVRFVLHFYLV